MTKREREQVRKAIDLLMGDECLIAEAMAILGPMVGMDYPAARIIEEAKAVDFREFAHGPNQTFRVTEPDKPMHDPLRNPRPGDVVMVGRKLRTVVNPAFDGRVWWEDRNGDHSCSLATWRRWARNGEVLVYGEG